MVCIQFLDDDFLQIMMIILVRDAARAHVCAMTNDRANGERFIISNQPAIWFPEMGKMLKAHFAQFGSIFFLR